MGLRGRSMSMRKSRKMHRSRSMGMSKRRTMRRSRMMRGGEITDSSAPSIEREDVAESSVSGEGPQVDGQFVPELDPNMSSMSSMSGGRRRRGRRSMKMRGGNDMALPEAGVQRTMYDGGKRRSRRNKSRRGGGLLATAAVPFGLWGLQRYFSRSRGSSEGSKNRRRQRR
jgi:hypothetical protein